MPVTTFFADRLRRLLAGGVARDRRALRRRRVPFRVVGPGGVEADAWVTLPGPFDVANALGAIVALVEAGVDLDDAVEAGRVLPGRPRPPPALLPPPGPAPAGRVRGLLAQARRGRGGACALRQVTAGTDHRARRRGRPGPGQAAADGAAAVRLADVAILTSDNPRSEDPLGVLDEMLHGVVGVPQGERGRLIIEPDRAAAISLAAGMAGKGDVVLVAGKGHETGQYVGGGVLPFDDAVVTAAAWPATPTAAVLPPPAAPAGRCAVIGCRSRRSPGHVGRSVASHGGGGRPGNRAGRDRLPQAVPGSLFAALPGERPTATTSPPPPAGRRGAVLAAGSCPGPARPSSSSPTSPSPSPSCAHAFGFAGCRAGRRRHHRVIGQDVHQGPHRPGGRAPRGKRSPRGLAQQRDRRAADRAARRRATRYLVLELSARGIGHIASLTESRRPGSARYSTSDGRTRASSGRSTRWPRPRASSSRPCPRAAGGVAILNADDPRVRRWPAAPRPAWSPRPWPEPGRARAPPTWGRSMTLDDLGCLVPAGRPRVPRRSRYGCTAPHVANALAAAAVAAELGLGAPGDRGRAIAGDHPQRQAHGGA